MTMERPDVSILIPAWNVARWIKESIDSVLAQESRYSYEVLVCDDGSTDGTADIVRGYGDGRVVLIEKVHSGISDALNLLMEAARGRYLMRFDADDVMLPGRIDHQIDIMEGNREIDLLSSGMVYMSDGGKLGNCGRVTAQSFVRGNVMVHGALVMRSSSVLGVLRYSNEFPYAEDFKLYHSALKRGMVLMNDPKPVMVYRTGHKAEGEEKESVMWAAAERVRALMVELAAKGC